MGAKGLAMNYQRIYVALVSMIVACTGCDRGWQAYDQIELGKPLPADSLLLAEGTAEGYVYVWNEEAYVSVPVINSRLYVCASVDDQGKVTAKTYTAQAGAHWGICQSAAMRQVMEVEVPEGAYHDPPAEGLPDRWVALLTTISSEGYVAPEEGWAQEAEAATNVLGYLILARNELSHHTVTGPVPFKEEPDWTTMILGALGMFTSARYYEFSRMPQYAPRLTEITEEGFDWTYRNPYGYELRIQNLGDRRFRLEEKYFRVFDPLMLLLMAQAALLGDRAPRDRPPEDLMIPSPDDMAPPPPDAVPDVIFEDDTEANGP